MGSFVKAALAHYYRAFMEEEAFDAGWKGWVVY